MGSAKCWLIYKAARTGLEVDTDWLGSQCKLPVISQKSGGSWWVAQGSTHYRSRVHLAVWQLMADGPHSSVLCCSPYWYNPTPHMHHSITLFSGNAWHLACILVTCQLPKLPFGLSTWQAGLFRQFQVLCHLDTRVLVGPYFLFSLSRATLLLRLQWYIALNYYYYYHHHHHHHYYYCPIPCRWCADGKHLAWSVHHHWTNNTLALDALSTK